MTTIALAVTGVLGTLYFVVLVSGTVYSRFHRQPQPAAAGDREPEVS